MDEKEKSGCLVVGNGVTIKGDILLPDTAFVHGKVEGTITAREVHVGATGVVKGKLVAAIADIHGEVSEHLITKEKLVLRSTGRIMGLVEYQTIEVEHGGVIQGSISNVSAQAADRNAPAPRPPRPIDPLGELTEPKG